MRKLVVATIAIAAASVAVLGAVPARAADADPSMHQIYQAAESGHLSQAQEMIDQVLRDHPASAKAHYVQAELFAREGKVASARAELGRAEQLSPGLPFARPAAVQALRSELAVASRAQVSPAERSAVPFEPAARHAPGLPWGTILLIALIAGALWMMFRRRAAAPSYATAIPGPGGAYAGGGGYGMPPAGPMGGPMGGGIAGGLASGLAVGAGVVAGEELAHHFLDGGHREGVAAPAPDESWRNMNTDLGGNDFGVDDAGTWDDGGSGGDGGGGGDDWT